MVGTQRQKGMEELGQGMNDCLGEGRPPVLGLSQSLGAVCRGDAVLVSEVWGDAAGLSGRRGKE